MTVAANSYYPYANHGAGIFTYMTGWFCSGVMISPTTCGEHFTTDPEQQTNAFIGAMYTTFRSSAERRVRAVISKDWSESEVSKENP